MDLPWRVLDSVEPSFSYASFYYADELARLPVRAITRIKDNKSDPNIETRTYGLFSTCQEKMRSGIVRHRPRYLFFVARPRGGPRQLTGMYELGWWAPGSLSGRIRDFSLMAKSVRFVTPEPLHNLPDEAVSGLSGRWRLEKRLEPGATSALVGHLMAKPDRTAEYLLEIDRMERINRFHSGYRYPTWRRTAPWTWDDAKRYLNAAPSGDPEPLKINNSSPSDWWSCADCGEQVENRALLKACPECGHLGSLRPLPAAPHDMEEAVA